MCEFLQWSHYLLFVIYTLTLPLSCIHKIRISVPVIPFVSFEGSLGFAVVDTRIWGYEPVYTGSYPQIRPYSTEIPNNSFRVFVIFKKRLCIMTASPVRIR